MIGKRSSATLNANAWRDRSDTQAKQLLGFFVKSPQFVGLGSGNNRPTPADIAAMPAYAAEPAQILSQPPAPENSRAADWPIGTHPRADERFYQAALRMDWNATETVTITSLTSFAHFSQQNQVDAAGIRVVADLRDISGKINSFFQGLRARGSFGGSSATWQVGANYIHDKSNGLVDQFTTQSGSYLSGFPPSVGRNPPFHSLLSYANNTTETKSIFGNLSLPILAYVKLNAGIRYTDVTSNFGGCVGTPDAQLVALVSGAFGDGSARVGDHCVTVLSRGGPSGYFRTTLNEDNVSWRVGLEWQATDGTLIYALVSKGYKAGASPTLTATVANQLQPVTQESVLDYEAGFKTSLINNTLKITANAFYYDYRDKQLFGRSIDPVFGALQSLVNIPKSHEFGAEASINWRPFTGLTLDGAATYLNSEVDSDFANVNAYGQAINYRGEAFPFTPEWSLVGGARYSWDINDRLGAFVSARGSYQTSSAASFGQASVAASGAPSVKIDGYGLLDLRAGFGSLSSVAVFCGSAGEHTDGGDKRPSG